MLVFAAFYLLSTNRAFQITFTSASHLCHHLYLVPWSYCWWPLPLMLCFTQDGKLVLLCVGRREPLSQNALEGYNHSWSLSNACQWKISAHVSLSKVEMPVKGCESFSKMEQKLIPSPYISSLNHNPRRAPWNVHAWVCDILLLNKNSLSVRVTKTYI